MELRVKILGKLHHLQNDAFKSLYVSRLFYGIIKVTEIFVVEDNKNPMFINVRVQISGGKGLQLKYTILHSIFHTQSSIIWGSLFFLNKRPSSFLWERKKETHTLDTFYVPALKVVTTLLLRIHCSEVIS